MTITFEDLHASIDEDIEHPYDLVPNVIALRDKDFTALVESTDEPLEMPVDGAFILHHTYHGVESRHLIVNAEYLQLW